jgi:hypothetical protein
MTNAAATAVRTWTPALPCVAADALQLCYVPQDMPSQARAGGVWNDLYQACNGRLGEALKAFVGIADGSDDDADIAPILALSDIGAMVWDIVAEPRMRMRPEKAARDAMLGRDTMHLAPQWRFPVREPRIGFEIEPGRAALIVPVTTAFGSPFAETLRMSEFDTPAAFAGAVHDLVALPLDGGRALSLTGFTIAVGLVVSRGETVTFYASGRGWMAPWLKTAMHAAADTPAHLIRDLVMPFAPPAGTLLVQPKALTWQADKLACVVPRDANRVECPDSRALAEWIDAEMRRRDKPRPMPLVCGPKERSP